MLKLISIESLIRLSLLGLKSSRSSCRGLCNGRSAKSFMIERHMIYSSSSKAPEDMTTTTTSNPRWKVRLTSYWHKFLCRFDTKSESELENSFIAHQILLLFHLRNEISLLMREGRERLLRCLLPPSACRRINQGDGRENSKYCLRSGLFPGLFACFSRGESDLQARNLSLIETSTRNFDNCSRLNAQMKHQKLLTWLMIREQQHHGRLSR